MNMHLKHLFLFAAGGLLYNVLELAFRGWSHWTMFFLGGVCFVCLGLINEVVSWNMPLWILPSFFPPTFCMFPFFIDLCTTMSIYILHIATIAVSPVTDSKRSAVAR